MFGRKTIEVKPKRKTVFSIPSDEAKIYLSQIIEDVNVILHNDKFMEAMKKAKLPENATIKDYENLVKRVAPNKIYNILSLFVNDCYDEVRRILACVFITDYEVYKRKSLNEMVEDIASLNTNEIRDLIRFFIH